MNNLEFIKDSIQQSIDLKVLLLSNETVLNSINDAATHCLDSFNNGRRLLLAGNGGSAADAQHIAAELVCRFNFDRPGLPAMALATNYSVITAAGNDYSYDDIFAREIEANGQSGDVFIGISTSGNSKNILKAVETAKEKGIFVIGLSGQGGDLIQAADLCINIPSAITPRVQECHILVGHILCEIIENTLYKK